MEDKFEFIKGILVGILIMMVMLFYLGVIAAEVDKVKKEKKFFRQEISALKEQLKTCAKKKDYSWYKIES